MKLFLIILAAGFVATTVATNMSDAVVQKARSIKGAIPDRVLSGGKKKTKTKTKKSYESACPLPTSYAPPESCSATCYSNITNLFNVMNNNIENGIPFDGTICQGTHTLPIDIYVNGTFWGVHANLSLRCCGPKNSCIIDGDNAVRYFSIFRLVAPVKEFVLEGITFQNVRLIEDYLTDGAGVVVEITEACVVKIRHVAFQSLFCLHSNYGGAIKISGGSSIVTIESCSFTNNQNYGSNGGAIAVVSSVITLKGNTFDGNEANLGGGAIYFSLSSIVAACNTFEQNRAASGGAIAAIYSDLELSNNMFRGNVAYAYGGAIYIFFHKMSSSANNYISNSAQLGGAIEGYSVAMKSSYDTFDLNELSSGNTVDGINMRLTHCILEYKCSSPILLTLLTSTVAFSDCI